MEAKDQEYLPLAAAFGRRLGRVCAPSHGPNGGVADSLDEAKAAFRAAWERPLSEMTHL
jgi:hypothetical protein